MITRLLLLTAALAAVLAQDGSAPLRVRSSRFRQLAGGQWGDETADTLPPPPPPVNTGGQATTRVRLAPEQSQPAGSIFNNPQPGRGIPSAFTPPQSPPRLSVVTPAPAPVQPGAASPPQAPQPVRIPPQIAELLGIQNLGIPGIIETGPQPQFTNVFAGTPNPSFSPNVNANPFGVQVQGNPTWGELAAQNPDLLRQLTDNGLANQPVLSSNSNPGLLNAINSDGSHLNTQFAAAPGQDSTNGFLNILGSLTQRLTQATGVRELLAQTGPALTGQQVPQFSPTNSGPTVAGIPRLPSNLALLPGGIPRDASGQVDYVSLMSAVTQRVTNGTTLSDIVPPNQLQLLADNITDALLPDTADVDLSKFMGRWFEGINSPRASEQRCIVHHYGGLTDNGKTATFTALKIYREGSEFGQVRYSIGYAFRGGHHMGMLQMHTSEAQDPAPYWIYRVGPEAPDAFGNKQYEYAVVSNWVKYPVIVLVRDPDIFKKKYEEEVLRYLEDTGFINGFIRAFNMLQPVSYENCQYSDSTFQVFGK